MTEYGVLGGSRLFGNVLDHDVGGSYSLLMEDVSKALFMARVSRGLSQREAAAQAGVSVQSWSNYEVGKSKPRAAALGRLARWLEREAD